MYINSYTRLNYILQPLLCLLNLKCFYFAVKIVSHVPPQGFVTLSYDSFTLCDAVM